MDRVRFQAVAVLAALLSSGCASSVLPSSKPFASLGIGRQAPLASAWDSSGAKASKSTSSSVFGSVRSPEPTVSQRLTSAITDNRVSKAVSNATNETVAFFKPKPKVTAAVDPISLGNKTKEPGAVLFIHMAAASEKANKLDQAEQLFKKATEKEPKNLDALLGYARFCDRQNRLGEAVNLYSRAVKLRPQSATAHNDLGLCYARHRQLNKSLASLEKAISLEPKNPLYRNNVAKVLTKMDRTDAALQHLLAVNPPAIAHYNLAYFLKSEGRDDAAHDHVTRSARIDPTFEPSQQWLAAVNRAPSHPNANVAGRYAPQIRVAQRAGRATQVQHTYLQGYQARNARSTPASRNQPTVWQSPVATATTGPANAIKAPRYSAAPAVSALPQTPTTNPPSLQPLPPVTGAIITR